MSNTNCDRCGQSIKVMLHTEDTDFPLIDNGSRIRFQGGYGMFFDDYRDGDFVMDLCHNCSISIMNFVVYSIKYGDKKESYFEHQHHAGPGNEKCCDYSYTDAMLAEDREKK